MIFSWIAFKLLLYTSETCHTSSTPSNHRKLQNILHGCVFPEPHHFHQCLPMCTVLCYVKRISNAFSPHFIAKTDYYRTQAHVLFTALHFIEFRVENLFWNFQPKYLWQPTQSCNLKAVYKPIKHNSMSVCVELYNSMSAYTPCSTK